MRSRHFIKQCQTKTKKADIYFGTKELGKEGGNGYDAHNGGENNRAKI